VHVQVTSACPGRAAQGQHTAWYLFLTAGCLHAIVGCITRSNTVPSVGTLLQPHCSASSWPDEMLLQGRHLLTPTHDTNVQAHCTMSAADDVNCAPEHMLWELPTAPRASPCCLTSHSGSHPISCMTPTRVFTSPFSLLDSSGTNWCSSGVRQQGGAAAWCRVELGDPGRP
jgi:hypothetical protein